MSAPLPQHDRPDILFLCVRNAARSQLAEGLARARAPAGVAVHSAGSDPGCLDPRAVEVMAERGIELAGQRSKSIEEVPIERIGLVVTLCADEVCPVLPAEVARQHWPLPDPAAAKGSDEEILDAFRRCRDEIASRLPALFAERYAPPARAVLDGLDLATLHARKSEKWNVYPDDVLPAWVAEMDFPLAEPIRAVLQQAVDRWDVGYPIAPSDTGMREAFADRMEERFGWSIDPARVEILSEVVQGLFIALEAYSARGEGAVVQTPIYPPFLSAVEETGRRLVENRLALGDRGYEIDFDALEDAQDADTRLLLLCNPHNPTGRVLHREELERLAELALRHDWIVVTDEIHCDLVFSGHEHIPFATLGPDVAARTVTLSSASKSFNIAGLRAAVAHFGSTELQKRFVERFPRHVRGGIGVLGLYASIAAWRRGQPWLDEVVPYLERNRDHLGARLAEQIPEIRFHAPEGTYLAWLDCRRLGLRGSPARHFLRHGRVALSDGRLFGPGCAGFVRLNFATSRAILDQVVERMASALELPSSAAEDPVRS